jgi:hypothetical protein
VNSLIGPLARVSKIWLDPQHPLREETILALQVSTGRPRRSIEMALANCFEELSSSKIAAYIDPFNQVRRRTRSEIQTWSKGATWSVLHVLPANVFTAWVHGAVITLLCGHRCRLKPSMHEPVFAPAWRKSLAEVDPNLAERVEIVGWDEKWLKESQTVVAYGSNETLGKIQSMIPAGVRFVGYGHKLSVGVLFHEAWAPEPSRELLERVRKDVEPFLLDGCLSPQILYMERSTFTRWKALEEAVEAAPQIKCFVDMESLWEQLSKVSPHLSCVGFAGTNRQKVLLEKRLAGLGVSRVCRLGEMQRPPLSWRNDGINLADLLH